MKIMIICYAEYNTYQKNLYLAIEYKKIYWYNFLYSVLRRGKGEKYIRST